MVKLAIVSALLLLFVLPDRVNFYEHVGDFVVCLSVDPLELVDGLFGCHVHRVDVARQLLLTGFHELELLLDDLVEFARPKEALKHGWSYFA